MQRICSLVFLISRLTDFKGGVVEVGEMTAWSGRACLLHLRAYLDTTQKDGHSGELEMGESLGLTGQLL